MDLDLLNVCHTALKSFYTGFKHAQWLIEGDIFKCFN